MAATRSAMPMDDPVASAVINSHRPAGPLNLQPVLHRQAHRGCRRAVQILGRAMGRQLDQHRTANAGRPRRAGGRGARPYHTRAEPVILAKRPFCSPCRIDPVSPTGQRVELYRHPFSNCQVCRNIKFDRARLPCQRATIELNSQQGLDLGIVGIQGFVRFLIYLAMLPDNNARTGEMHRIERADRQINGILRRIRNGRQDNQLARIQCHLQVPFMNFLRK